MDSYTIVPQPMISAQAEAEEKVYHQHTSGTETWLIADVDNSADYIYCSTPSNHDGFGGREVKFKLVDGTTFTAVGPWHSNASALYAATGIDVRDKHLQKVVISKKREWNSAHRAVMSDILFIDDEPVLGTYSRYRELAVKYANELGVPVFYYQQSVGGSVTGRQEPTGGK